MRRFSIAPVLLAVGLTGCATLQTPVYNSGLGASRLIAELRADEIVIDGHSISYLERQGDDDDETILLLHGFASEKDAWIQFANQIPSGYRILIPDLPGHGASDPLVERAYTPDVLVAMIGAFKQALGASELHIVGNSMGGMYALIYAHEHPDEILSLTLIDSAGIYPPQPSELQRRLASGSNPLIVDEPADFDELMAFVFYKEPFMPWPVRPELRRKHLERSALNHKIWADIWTSRADYRHRLADLTTPLLVVWGRDDRVLDVSTTAAIRHQRPDASIHIVPDCGHSPMLERPELTATIFYAFVRDL